MQIVEKRIKDIKPYENNPRINAKAVNAVAESIKLYGFKVPIVLDKDNTIVCGHTRYKASIKLKLEKVPCVIASDLTPQQIKAYRIADNRTSDFAEWDLELLGIEVAELQELGVDMSAFELDDLFSEFVMDELDTVIDDEFEPEIPAEPTTKLGDIYLLGNHRLICGDCTDKQVITKLMYKQLADLLLTDPPYNVDYSQKALDLSRWRVNKSGHNDISTKNRVINGTNDIANDKLDNSDFATFLSKFYEQAHNAIRAGGACYVFHSGQYSIEFMSTMAKYFEYSQTLIWVKNNFVLSRKPYHYKHEPILFGYKKGGKRYFIDSRSEDTVIEDNGVNYKKLSKQELLDTVLKMTADTVATTVLKEDIVHVCDLHPTMKPIRLLARIIRNSSKQNDIVLDTFGGSGSTLIACEQMNRCCYMVELSPAYCDVIIKRYEDYTGNKPKLIRSTYNG